MRATWLNRRFAATVRAPCKEEMDSAKNSMVKFADYSKLRKVALMGTFLMTLSQLSVATTLISLRFISGLFSYRIWNLFFLQL